LRSYDEVVEELAYVLDVDSEWGAGARYVLDWVLSGGDDAE